MFRRAIGGAMKLRGLTACLGLALLLPACRKPAEVTVDSKRPITMRDEGLKVDASSNARFQEPGSSPILAGEVPEGWLALPSSQFRLLNYRFGEGGEVAVGLSTGDLSGNVNRWLAQFGKDPLDASGIGALEKVEVLGVTGVWLEAEGEYNPGMGQESRGQHALAGVIADDNGRIITVKMTGPVSEVSAQKEALRRFVAGLSARGE